MANIDLRDLYIKYKGHPKFSTNKVIEDDTVSVIVQKYEVILFTNKGEVFGLPDFGCNLEELLYQTKVSSSYVADEIKGQIQRYIPELVNMNYRLRVEFVRDSSYQEAMVIYFTLADYEVFAAVGSGLDQILQL